MDQMEEEKDGSKREREEEDDCSSEDSEKRQCIDEGDEADECTCGWAERNGSFVRRKDYETECGVRSTVEESLNNERETWDTMKELFTEKLQTLRIRVTNAVESLLCNTNDIKTALEKVKELEYGADADIKLLLDQSSIMKQNIENGTKITQADRRTIRDCGTSMKDFLVSYAEIVEDLTAIVQVIQTTTKDLQRAVV